MIPQGIPYDWIGVSLNIWGILLNAKQKMLCFPIWLVSNVFWALHWWPKREWGALFLVVVVYTVLNSYGWISWYKLNKAKNAPSS